jgi:hypothetical protein
MVRQRRHGVAAMDTLHRQARLTGLLYILLALLAPLRLIYIPTKLFVAGDAGATAANVLAHESLFRWGIVADLCVGTILVFVVLALYRLLHTVSRPLAIVMVILGGILPAAIYYLNTVNDAAALLLMKGAPYLDTFDEAQRTSLGMLFLRLHGQVVVAAEMLWGLWLIPLAILVFRSGFLPRFFGLWLALNGFAYIIQSVAGFLAPGSLDRLDDLFMVLQLGEVAFMLWMLLFGARRHPFQKEIPA